MENQNVQNLTASCIERGEEKQKNQPKDSRTMDMLASISGNCTSLFTSFKVAIAAIFSLVTDVTPMVGRDGDG